MAANISDVPTRGLSKFSSHRNRSPTVEYIPVGVNNTAEIAMDIGEDGPAQALVIVPTTRYTRQPARYTLSFSGAD